MHAPRFKSFLTISGVLAFTPEEVGYNHMRSKVGHASLNTQVLYILKDRLITLFRAKVY